MFQIQTKTDGQWTTDGLGDESANEFASFGEAQAAVVDLIDSFGMTIDQDGTEHAGTGETLATDDRGRTHQYRVIEAA